MRSRRLPIARAVPPPRECTPVTSLVAMPAILLTTASAMVVLPSGVTSALCRVRAAGAVTVVADSLMVTSLGLVTYTRLVAGPSGSSRSCECDLGHTSRDAEGDRRTHAAPDGPRRDPRRGARPAGGDARPRRVPGDRRP